MSRNYFEILNVLELAVKFGLHKYRGQGQYNPETSKFRINNGKFDGDKEIWVELKFDTSIFDDRPLLQPVWKGKCNDREMARWSKYGFNKDFDAIHPEFDQFIDELDEAVKKVMQEICDVYEKKLKEDREKHAIVARHAITQTFGKMRVLANPN